MIMGTRVSPAPRRMPPLTMPIASKTWNAAASMKRRRAMAITVASRLKPAAMSPPRKRKTRLTRPM